MSFQQPFDKTDPKSTVQVEIKEISKGVLGKVSEKYFRAEGPYLLVKELLDDYKGEEDGG